MKFLIILSLSFFSSKVFSCTDFTGEYQTAVLTYYSISQNGCESMDVIDESGSNHMTFDNIEKLLFEYDIDVAGETIAHVEIFLKSKMLGDKWVYNERNVTTFKDGEKEEHSKWAEVSFNKDTDLLTVLHNEDGSIEEFVDIRYKK